MREGWKTSTLGETCEMYQPKTISGKEMVEDGEYPVYGANGVIGRYDQFNHEESQLLITCRGATCGAVNISAPRSWITGNAMVVRPKNGSVEMRFLEYLFRGGIDISKAITGAAQPQITRTNLTPLEISYPVSVDEQKRIVAILDEAFAGIATAVANTEKNLTNARDLFDSQLNNTFTQKGVGWEEKPLGELCKIQTGKKDVNQGNPEGIYPFFTCAKNHTFSDVYSFDTEAILIAGNGDVGNVSYYNGKFEAYQRTYVLTNFENILPWYLYLVLDGLLKATVSAQRLGNTMPYIKKGMLTNFAVPIPPLPEQQRIVSRLNALSSETQRLESIYQHKLADLAELKQSLLHKAFSGELTAQPERSLQEAVA